MCNVCVSAGVRVCVCSVQLDMEQQKTKQNKKNKKNKKKKKKQNLKPQVKGDEPVEYLREWPWI